jgi:hypothetical protein
MTPAELYRAEKAKRGMPLVPHLGPVKMSGLVQAHLHCPKCKSTRIAKCLHSRSNVKLLTHKKSVHVRCDDCEYEWRSFSKEILAVSWRRVEVAP